MALRFRRRESPIEGFRRLVRGLAASIVSLLADCGSDLPERIHKARRDLKRLRALIRLVHDDRAAADIFSAEDTRLRDAGKRLAAARDAEAALATLDSIATKKPGFPLIRRQLARRAKSRPAQRTLSAIAAEVRTSGHTLDAAEPGAKGWRLIGPGITDSCIRAAEAYRTARKDPAPAPLHEWRKLVKRLAFQLDFLRRALGRRHRRLLVRLVRLGDLLGRLNDIEVLRSTLATIPACPEKTTLIPILDHESARIRKRTFALAKRAFATKPARLAQQLHKAWRRWHQ